MTTAGLHEPSDALVDRFGGMFRWLVAGLGWLLVAASLWLLRAWMRADGGAATAVGIGVSLLLAVGILALGVWLARTSFGDPEVLRATQWAFGGVAVLIAANALVLATGLLSGEVPSGRTHAATLLVLNAGVGAAFGTTVGVYRMRDRLQSAHARQLNRAMNAASDGIAVVGADGRFAYVNAAFANLHGWGVEDLDGAQWESLYAEETASELRSVTERVLAQGTGWRDTITVRQPNGRRFPAEVSMTGVDGGVVVVARDVTERRERRQRLSVLHRLLRHNLRNKLNVIIGRSDMLEDLESEPARRNGAAIRDVAYELLEISRTAREIEMLMDSETAPRPVSLAEHVESAVEQVRANAPDASITVEVAPALTVVADPHLRAAVHELVENAVVHNDADRPTVRVSAERTGGGNVALRVADDGPGIPEQERSVLIEGRERPLHHGSGLGLWLVHWLVTKSGGTLEFGANTPTGSVVTVRLRAPEDSEEGSQE